MIETHQQHAQTGQCDQCVGDDVQRQGVDEQQQQAARDDQQNVAPQQFVQRVLAQWRKEAQGEHQTGWSRQQQCQISARRLNGLPVRQPRTGEVEQQKQTQPQQAFTDRQPQTAARARVGVAHQVVQQEHGEAAEQQAENQRLLLIGGAFDCRLQGDVRAQLMVGNHAYVDVQRFVGLGQRQHEIAARQWMFGLGPFVAGIALLDQPVAVEHVEIELGQVGGKDAQHLFVLARRQFEAQPQGAVGFGRGQAVKLDGAELIGVASGADVAQLQDALIVKQYRPATALRGLGREHAEQGHQRDGEAYGNPEPAHGEIPS